jgi:hypothetical protein
LLSGKQRHFTLKRLFPAPARHHEEDDEEKTTTTKEYRRRSLGRRGVQREKEAV